MNRCRMPKTSLFNALIVLLLSIMSVSSFVGRGGGGFLIGQSSRIAMISEVYNKVTFEYCTKCRWGLRASWMAQELLTTFRPDEVHEVSLIPISEPAGTFTVRINGKVVWDRRNEETPGFPEAKKLKQRVRDVVSPDLNLGHSDSQQKKASRVIEISDGVSQESESIKKVIQHYLDGLYEGDVSKIAEAFHPSCCLTHMADDTLKVVPRDDWLQLVKNRASPQSQGLTRHDELLSVDVISPTTAFVKLKCAIPPRFFIDSLNLLKVDGRWQICQKLFSVEVKAQ